MLAKLKEADESGFAAALELLLFKEDESVWKPKLGQFREFASENSKIDPSLLLALEAILNSSTFKGSRRFLHPILLRYLADATS